MNLALFFMPLIGGYVFLSSCNFTKYNTIFDSGYRLFFKSALWGMILLITATFLLSIITELAKMLTEIVNIENTIIGTIIGCINSITKYVMAKNIEKFVVPTGLRLESILAMFMGLVLPRILNQFGTADLHRKNAAEDRGNQLFLTVSKSLADVELIELSMASGKVYIGFPLGIKLNDEYIKIDPHFSGYRDAETRVLKITSKYREISQKRKLFVSIKVDEIVSVRIFYLDVFQYTRSAGSLDKTGRIIEYV